MNKKLFSEAMGELDDRYLAEAVELPRTRPVRVRFWSMHKVAACLCIAVLGAALSFGTAFAVNADFRQFVISYLFPLYEKSDLQEIEEGHRTGSFDRTDTLLTFLEKFNDENMLEGITAKKENGFHYLILAETDHITPVIVECEGTDNKLLVLMEQKPYQETTGLWQITAYQIIDSQTADEMVQNQK